MELVYEEETYGIRGAIYEVFNVMGSGFLESVYQECLENELRSRAIPFSAQVGLNLFYKNTQLQQSYKPDFICYNKIIIELKSASDLTKQNEAQLMNYLKATGMKLGLLVNFGAYSKVQIKRMVL